MGIVSTSYVGRSVERVEDAALLSGLGRYIDDLGTRPGTLHAAARCVAAGIDVADITRRLYRTRSYGRTKLMGLVLAGLEVSGDGPLEQPRALVGRGRAGRCGGGGGRAGHAHPHRAQLLLLFRLL